MPSLTDEAPTIEEFRQRAAVWYAYLSQGEVWYNREGRRLVIAEMPLGYRENVLRYLERQARMLEFWYTIGEIGWINGLVALSVLGTINGKDVEGPPVYIGPSDLAQDSIDREQDARAQNPEQWLRTTKLYRALADKL